MLILSEHNLHCSIPNRHHFSEKRKCFALNRKSRSGTGTHLSEKRRCSSAHGLRAAHVPKLRYQHFVSNAPVTQQAEKRRCRTGPCDHLIRIQFLPSVCGCKKSGSLRQFEDISRKPGRRVFLYFVASDPTFSMSCPSYKGLALEIQSLPF